MKIKKLLSLFSAAAISASCFAGMAVTASAEEAANDDYVEWTVLGTTRKNSVDSLYEKPVQHKNTLTEQPTFAFILGEDNKVSECMRYKAAADYTFTKFSNKSMTVASAPEQDMYAIKLGTATGGGIKISNILPDGCDYESYDIKVVYSLRYANKQGLQITYDSGDSVKDEHDNGDTKDVYTVKEFNVTDVKSSSITLTRTNSEVELLYVGIKYKVRTGDPTYAINCKNDVEAVSYNGGTVTIGDNLTSAEEGTPITVIPTPYENFEIGEVKYGNGSDYTTITPQDGVYSFNMPAHSVTVTATFNYKDSDSVLKYFGHQKQEQITNAQPANDKGVYCLNYVERKATVTFNDVEYTKGDKELSSVTVLSSNKDASTITVEFNDEPSSIQTLGKDSEWNQKVGESNTFYAYTVPFTAKPKEDKTLKITIDSTIPLNAEGTNTYIGNYWMLVLNYTTPAPEFEDVKATVDMKTNAAGKHAAAAYATVKISDLNNKTLKWSITASNGDQSDTKTVTAKYVDGAFSGDGSAVLGLLVSGIPDGTTIDSAKIILE